MAYCAVGSSTVAPLYTDTGLIGEFDRTANLDTSLANYASTTLTGNVFSFTRVFKLDTNVNPAYYGTVGWSYTATPGNNLFSKSLILTVGGGAGPVLVLQGQYLRIYYTINVTINPSSTINGNSNITGLPAADGGSYGLQYVGLKAITSSNTYVAYDNGGFSNEMYYQNEAFLSTVGTAPAAFGATPVNRSTTSYLTQTTNVYAGPGTGIVKKIAGFGKNNAAGAAIASMGLGPVGSSTTNTGFVYVFTNVQTKAALYNFSPIFLYSIVSHS